MMGTCLACGHDASAPVEASYGTGYDYVSGRGHPPSVTAAARYGYTGVLGGTRCTVSGCDCPEPRSGCPHARCPHCRTATVCCRCQLDREEPAPCA